MSAGNGALQQKLHPAGYLDIRQILSVDETIKNVKSEAPPQMPGRGMGRPMMG
ncbi:hypothetical protein RR48_02587 [Papilio machaon]|uniref:Uncharacterized protein n=1 Tax=Papilio machaon TaxID=76193 RepID=A0A0N1IGE8_PAPMA|nr:hypothetical protein RR48_02587 [Papilio machaon]